MYSQFERNKIINSHESALTLSTRILDSDSLI
ncbi:protein of unknown function (plasmid) [Caballeronia sp. S22]